MYQKVSFNEGLKYREKFLKEIILLINFVSLIIVHYSYRPSLTLVEKSFVSRFDTKKSREISHDILTLHFVFFCFVISIETVPFTSETNTPNIRKKNTKKVMVRMLKYLWQKSVSDYLQSY
jgi:hypothetical protein